MKAKHTPTEWLFGFYGPTDRWVRTADGDAIVEVGFNRAEREADRHLIALAPLPRTTAMTRSAPAPSTSGSWRRSTGCSRS